MRYLTQMGNHIRRASNSWTENNNSISIEDVLNYVATVLYFFFILLLDWVKCLIFHCVARSDNCISKYLETYLLINLF